MVKLLLAGAAVILALATSSVSAQCVVRKEWNELSPSEISSFFAAVNKLKARPMSGSTNPSVMGYDDFVTVHYNAAIPAHGQPQFFPWHRKLLLDYEAALLSVDPTIVLPYWDWTRDSQSPISSVLFAANAFGGDGSGDSYCVTTGAFSSWSSNPNGIWVPDRLSLRGKMSKPLCLSRNFIQGAAFWSADSIGALINQKTDYDSFHQAIEGSPHGSVHTIIGGTYGDMTPMSSTNDPIFFMHHAMVDKIWSRWQEACPQYLHQYNGQITLNTPAVAATVNDVMGPWTNVVNDVIDTRNILNNAGRCYTYSNSGTLDQWLAANKFTCPGGNPSASPILSVSGSVTITISPTATSNTTNPNSTATSSTLPSAVAASQQWFQNALLQLIPPPNGSKFLVKRADYCEPGSYGCFNTTSSTVASSYSSASATAAPSYVVSSTAAPSYMASSTAAPSTASSTTGYSNATATSVVNATVTGYSNATATSAINATVTGYVNGTATHSVNATITGYSNATATSAVNATVTGYSNATATISHSVNATSTACLNATSTISYASPTVKPSPPVYSPLPNITVYAPAGNDTTDLVHIRHPYDLPDSYIKMMHLDPYTVRQTEVNNKHYVDTINNKPDYVSPSALQYHSAYADKKKKCNKQGKNHTVKKH
ncbi:uncharacterized protein BJ171DRAFT_272697 [Polychytrium aggregatum]|uniref:uncharacterized protein n=1 Tax=Polychytrium aggregatum TaxID=110093 RepID=UPI0022FE867B|nr:uncharacterized protein BJ171DRAFT_272697 [Polychytrium aggregatum]KAI9193319.1 hypothetical protein BJ171DRAFT_272697 [Polychytrium aggregatum]